MAPERQTAVTATIAIIATIIASVASVLFSSGLGADSAASILGGVAALGSLAFAFFAWRDHHNNK